MQAFRSSKSFDFQSWCEMQGQGSGGGISTAEEGIKEEPVSEEEVSNLKTFRQLVFYFGAEDFDTKSL